MEEKARYTGYSNGKKYPVYKIAPYDENIGLAEVEGLLFMSWCRFEKIEEKFNPSLH